MLYHFCQWRQRSWLRLKENSRCLCCNFYNMRSHISSGIHYIIQINYLLWQSLCIMVHIKPTFPRKRISVEETASRNVIVWKKKKRKIKVVIKVRNLFLFLSIELIVLVLKKIFNTNVACFAAGHKLSRPQTACNINLAVQFLLP